MGLLCYESKMPIKPNNFSFSTKRYKHLYAPLISVVNLAIERIKQNTISYRGGLKMLRFKAVVLLTICFISFIAVLKPEISIFIGSDCVKCSTSKGDICCPS